MTTKIRVKDVAEGETAQIFRAAAPDQVGAGVTGKTVGYPARFVLDAAGAPVNPATDKT